VSTPAAADQPLPAAHRRTIAVTVVLAAIVLIINAGTQIYDSNFYAMTGAMSLLSGDRIYRDFFEPGVPLAAYTAALAQILSEHRLIGEFVRQWLFILAGVGIAAHLGLRLSRSPRATLATMTIALLLLAATPIYHYDKLFFLPLMIWACWRYIEQPTPLRATLCGCVTAIAFLFRHDYGIYLGATFMIAFVLARIGGRRVPKALMSDAGAYTMAVSFVLAPWVVVVQRTEGLVDYTRSRVALFQGQPAGFAYRTLLHINPIRTFKPPLLPAPRKATVVIAWDDTVDESLRGQLERDYALRFVETDDRGRRHYEVPNVYDMRLLGIEPYVNDTEGFQWDVLKGVRRGLPALEGVMLWIQQVALLIPIALMITAIWDVSRSWRGGALASEDSWRMMLASGSLVVVELLILREPSYIVVVAPVTAALSARFLVSKSFVTRACVMTLGALTMVAALLWAGSGLSYQSPADLATSVRSAFAQLIAFPPDYGYLPFRYLRECTAPGDHILVTGNTPLHVSYYAQRPIAGGQINWHYGWRSDPIHEAQALGLLQRQSVPIALSTADSVLDNFTRYPHINAYLAEYYANVSGTDGYIMVDKRRRPTGTFGPMKFPCFR
jgi:hypothetical protein